MTQEVIGNINRWATNKGKISAPILYVMDTEYDDTYIDEMTYTHILGIGAGHACICSPYTDWFFAKFKDDLWA